MDRPIKYQQTDLRWGANDYSAPGEHTNIAKAGCGPTCAAMVIASLKDATVTPAETAKWSKAHGYKAPHQGTYYTYFVPQLKVYGIPCRRLNTANIYGAKTETAKAAHSLAERELKKGNWIIACCGPGLWTSTGHFVLAYKTDGSRIYINDPASEKPMRECNDLKLWQSQVKYYWAVDVQGGSKQPEKEDDEVVEDLTVTIFGKEYQTKGIFKDNANYLSPKVFKDAGMDVTNIGGEAVINPGTIKVNINGKERVITGFNSDGTNYAGVRQIAEMLGHTVSWKNGVIVIE